MTQQGTYVSKACAYITRNDRAELLVFRSPEFDSLQVPKGTIGPDESPRSAVRREVEEESGLSDFGPVRHVASDVWTRRSAPLRKYVRHFYHLEVDVDRDAWTHVVDCDGPESGLAFEFFWVDLPTEHDFALALDDYLLLCATDPALLAC